VKNHQSNTEPDVPPSQRDSLHRLLNGGAGSSLVLVCEHASNHIPEHLNALGLPSELRDSHIVWDPGALAVAKHLSRSLDARLVASSVSRLVYDCNRPPDAPDAIPARSEIFDIPGNADLSEADKAERVRIYYTPFDSLLSQTIAATPRQPTAPVLITVHSFTPVYRGQHRTTEIGILHDSDTRLADAILALAAGHSPLAFRRNDPYGPADGVTHTLKRHGIRNGLMNVMLEIRNDLIAGASQQRDIAAMLAGLLKQALAALVKEEFRSALPGSENGGSECHP
jgi:predicted N-formylglutamate amidohydrolase